MQRATTSSRPIRTGRWNVHVLTALLLLSGVVAAESLDALPGAPLPQAPATDPPAAAVAAELLQLQKQLGGSIVGKAPMLAQPQPPSDAGDPPNSSLREAAWQLDLAARRLELANLFEQADAIRSLSGQLRRDARAAESGNMPRSANAD